MYEQIKFGSVENKILAWAALNRSEHMFIYIHKSFSGKSFPRQGLLTVKNGFTKSLIYEVRLTRF